MIFHPCLSFPPLPSFDSQNDSRAGVAGSVDRRAKSIFSANISRVFIRFLLGRGRSLKGRKEGRKERTDEVVSRSKGKGAKEREMPAGISCGRRRRQATDPREYFSIKYSSYLAQSRSRRGRCRSREKNSLSKEKERENLFYSTRSFFFFFFHFCYSLVLFDRGDEINISPQYRIVEASRTIFNENF